jgi:hypothetical protein
VLEAKFFPKNIFLTFGPYEKSQIFFAFSFNHINPSKLYGGNASWTLQEVYNLQALLKKKPKLQKHCLNIDKFDTNSLVGLGYIQLLNCNYPRAVIGKGQLARPFSLKGAFFIEKKACWRPASWPPTIISHYPLTISNSVH